MNYRIRTTGPDLPSPDGLHVAVDRMDDNNVFQETVGYAADVNAANEYIRRSLDGSSHKGFFDKRKKRLVGNVEAAKAQQLGEQFSEETPQEARQSMRRQEAFRAMFDDMLAARQAPGGGPAFLYVTWEEFANMHREYQDAVKADDGSHKRFPFQPLSAYAQKIRRIRQPFQNEMGVWENRAGESKYVILRDRGPGDVGDKVFASADVKGGQQ